MCREGVPVGRTAFAFAAFAGAGVCNCFDAVTGSCNAPVLHFGSESQT